MAKRKGIREIEWDGKVCIYDNGHIDPEQFLASVRDSRTSDVSEERRAELTVSDVEHVRFRPMSPYEARVWGCNSGVMEAEEKEQGYPVTRVII